MTLGPAGRRRSERDGDGGPAGRIEADTALLRKLDPNTHAALPEHYVDKTFACRSCGKKEVFSATAQQWRYERVGARPDARAVLCADCRRRVREQRRTEQAAPGASRSREEVGEILALGDLTPEARAETRIEEALTSKWWSHRVTAIKVLGAWGTPEARARLRGLSEAWTEDRWPESKQWASVAARAARRALERHPTD